MTDAVSETNRRRLYIVSGVMQKGDHYEVLAGCLLAASEDEARGNHVRWMQGVKPGYLVHSVHVWVVSDELVAEAAREACHV